MPYSSYDSPNPLGASLPASNRISSPEMPARSIPTTYALPIASLVSMPENRAASSLRPTANRYRP